MFSLPCRSTLKKGGGRLKGGSEFAPKRERRQDVSGLARKSKSEPVPESPDCFRQFVSAFQGRDGVDGVVFNGDHTVTIRNNGGGITLSPGTAGGTQYEFHPDEVLARTSAPEMLGPALRFALGVTPKGFKGESPKLVPAVRGAKCVRDDHGYAVAFPDGTAARIVRWQPERPSRVLHLDEEERRDLLAAADPH